MAKRFLTPLNFANLSLDPESGSIGDIYYNIESEKFRYFDGESWNDLGSGTGTGITISENPPGNPSQGNAWFKESTNAFYIYDGTYWIEIATTISLLLSDDPNPTLGANMSASGFSIEDVGYLGFDTDFDIDSISASPGLMFWNDEEGTVDLVMKNEVLQSIGMEFYMPPTKNNSGELIPNGSFVMATGVQGDRITIAKAVTDGTVDPMYMIGIATEDIPDESEDGLVTTDGIVRGLNTNAWEVGDILYPNPSVAGGLTTTKPNAPNIRTAIAIVLRKNVNAGWIYVRMTNGSTLGETDSNVKFDNLQDGDLIVYNSASAIWTNIPATEASIQSGDNFPENPQDNSLFFKIPNLTLYVYVGGAWLDVGSKPPLDGGEPSTDNFDEGLDGGEPETTFLGGISGGAIIQDLLIA
jgi:hypothetical protein